MGLGRRLTKLALSMSTRQIAHVASIAAGSVTSSKTIEKFTVGTDLRRNEDARAAASCASAAAISGDCSEDSSELCADDFAIKRTQTRITKRPVHIIKTRSLIMPCFSPIGVGPGVVKLSAAITEATKG